MKEVTMEIELLDEFCLYERMEFALDDLDADIPSIHIVLISRNTEIIKTNALHFSLRDAKNMKAVLECYINNLS